MLPPTDNWPAVVRPSHEDMEHPPPLVNVDDITVKEGHDGTTTTAAFTVTLSAAVPFLVAVDYATEDAIASSGFDYKAANATLVFDPYETAKTVNVEVLGDTVDEPDETFFVNLSAPSNAVIDDGRGVGTITDDDRNGLFTCRASALRLGTNDPWVANDPNVPCSDGESYAVSGLSLAAGGISADITLLTVLTKQEPDDPAATPPAAGDDANATSSVDEVRIVAEPYEILAKGLRSQATVECINQQGVLAPVLSTSFTLASLKVNGSRVLVNGSAVVRVGQHVLTVNEKARYQ